MTHGLPKIRTPKARTVIAKPDELRKLFTTAEPWLRCYLCLTYGLGLRHAEACSISPRSFNKDDHTITFTKKGGDQFTLPTTRELEAIFNQAPETDDPSVSYLQLLRGNLGLKSKNISTVAVRQSFYKLRKRAGVNEEIRPHDLRRTLAVETLNRTKDIRLVQQILGHSSLSTTAKYLENRSIANIRDYLDTIPMPTEVKQ
jgi:integrase/recombinase XerC